MVDKEYLIKYAELVKKNDTQTSTAILNLLQELDNRLSIEEVQAIAEEQMELMNKNKVLEAELEQYKQKDKALIEKLNKVVDEEIYENQFDFSENITEKGELAQEILELMEGEN